SARTAGTARTAAFVASAARATGAAVAAGRTLPVGALIAVLRCEEARGCAQRQREDDDLCFHWFICLLRFPRARRLHRFDAIKIPVGAQKELPASDGRRG